MTDNTKDAINSCDEAAQWTWITATNAESRRTAKSHTSREVKRRKKILSQRIRVKKDGIRKPLLPANAKEVRSIELSRRAPAPEPMSSLGAGRVDPFAAYPFSTSLQINNEGVSELVDHFLFTAPSLQLKPQKRVCFLPLFQEIRRVSFELAQNNPAAFHTVLAIAAADRSILYNDREPVQAIAHSTKSIRILKEHLSDPESAISDKTITTISLQIVFLLLFESCDAVKTHQAALENIVKLRGGVETIELSNPQLTLLIDLADYLPPAVALLGSRMFRLLDETISDSTRLSPIASVAPNGLEALSNFDMYHDITRICRSLQRATNSAFSGDFWTSSVTENRLKSQLQDLLALGISKIAWGRRCEIMKCVCLSGLVYLSVVSQKGVDFVSASQQLIRLLPTIDATYNRHFHSLIGELLFGDLGDHFESLAALMRIGALLDHQTWIDIRQHLNILYGKTYGETSHKISPETKNDSQQTEMAGLTALFGFFSISG